MTKQEQRDQDQTEDKSLSSVRPKTTAQERRDLDYLAGYGYGLESTMPESDLKDRTVAFIRGYRAGREDWASNWAAKRGVDA
jgi:N-acetyl-anhydromuramyl-L-alanine amidase AmpD